MHELESAPLVVRSERGGAASPVDASPLPAQQATRTQASTTGAAGRSASPLEPLVAPLSLRLKRRAKTAIDAVPALAQAAHGVRRAADLVRLSAGRACPSLLHARPRKLTMAITALCNLRCAGCRYGRDFMPGAELPLPLIRHALLDAARAGVESVRIYGGEPLLHRDLPDVVAMCRDLGLSFYVTTNGLLLGAQADELRRAGLRDVTVGFYGTGAQYDAYVQRPERFARLDASLHRARDVFGSDLRLQMNFLLMKPSCTDEALDAAWAFADRHDMSFTVDLVHYSLPYFVGPECSELQFDRADEERIRRFVDRLLALKAARPDRLREPIQSLRSTPDWLLRGPGMRVPCDAEKLIWIGADGTVRLCYAAFTLGNLHTSRLRDLIASDAHDDAARKALRLECPTCHCERAERIMKHLPSRLRYGRATSTGSAS